MKDIVTKTDGVSTYSADEFNPNMTELENAVTTSNQTLDPTGTNLIQLSEAMGRYGSGGADFYTDSGIANAYVLNSTLSFTTPKVYFDGMRIVFTAGNTSTGVSTINVNAIGVVDLKDATGNAIGKDYITAGDTFTAIHNNANSEFRIVASSRVIPFGLITLFVGAIVDIPTGWALCDGTNGTPDLRNFFPRGAGSVFSVGQTGGSDVTGEHSLTEAENGPHDHTVTSTGSFGNTQSGSGGSALETTSVRTTSQSGNGDAHSHPDTVPPFFALAFIMKL